MVLPIRMITGSIRQAAVADYGAPRFTIHITSGRGRTYSHHCDSLDEILRIIGTFLPRFKPDLITRFLQHSLKSEFSGELGEQDEADFFALLPARTCRVRFTYVSLSSGGFSLRCARTGFNPGTDQPSTKRYASLADMAEALRNIGVEFKGKQIDPAIVFTQKAADLQSLGFDISKVC